ncbi:MAG: thioesterase family protein [Hyphomonas sp.]
MDPYFRFSGAAARASADGAGPWDPTMLHGGAPAGLIVRILEDLPSAVPMRLTRLTIDLQRPVPVGDLDIAVRVTREGRNIQTAEVILSANGKDVVRASGLRIRRDDLDIPAEAGLGATPLQVPQTPTGFGRPVGFNKTVDMREDTLAKPDWAARAVWTRIERPFFDDRDTTPLMRAAAAGDYCNGFGSSLDFEQWTYINADLTLHFAREPVGEWIRLAANSWISPDGRGIAFGELADTQGVFGRATQSLVIARR